MIVGYGMPHYRFNADTMTDRDFSLIASFELYFLPGFSTSVSVYGLRGSTGFDLLKPLTTCFYKI